MGCDIHLFTERKRTINSSEKWQNIDHFKINPYAGSDDEPKYSILELYDGRNYALFSALADVRNYGNTPFISEPKGIPEDASDYYKKIVESWEGDGHSHSYFTLKELKDFDEKQPFELHSGFVSPEDASKIDLDGTPPSISCQGTSIENWIRKEWKEESSLKRLIRLVEARKKEDFGFYIEEHNLPEYDEEIRIVFFFDN